MKISIPILTVFVGLMACGESSFSPSSPKVADPVTVTPLPGTGATQPTVEPAESTGCDLIKLVRSSVKSETDCKKGVRFYLEAPGADYFNIHLGGLNNGPILGPNAPGEWSKWYALKAGSYVYTAAAEAKVDGKVTQCDLHNKTFTIPECKEGCVKPPAPQCDFGPAIYNAEDCTYQCPPCVMPPVPKCPFGEAIPVGCGWVCPPCVLDDPPEFPHGPPIANLETCEWVCPPCIMPPPPECPFGPPVPHPVVCSWVCPPCEVICPEGEHLHPETCDCWCDPIGKPECPEQTWNEELCVWEGDCPCECEGMPECPEQICNPKTCEWQGDCPCEPEGEGECPDFCEWDFELCEWVCDCPCEPEGEPECDEQEWDTELCEWVGDCPCEAPHRQCIRSFGRKTCSNFGLVTLYKNDNGGDTRCTSAEMDAAGVIVKGGVYYHFIPDVTQGDNICTCTTGIHKPDWSHVEYCGCPEQ